MLLILTHAGIILKFVCYFSLKTMKLNLKYTLLVISGSILLIVTFGLAFYLLTAAEVNRGKSTEVITNIDSTKPTPNNRPLQILNKTKIKMEFEVYGPSYSTYVETNKPIKLSKDSYFCNLYELGQNKYVLEISPLNEGLDEFRVTFVDEVDQKEELIFKISSKKINPVKDWEDFVYTDPTKDLLTVVDKKHKLTSTYEPDDLVELGSAPYSLYTNRKNLMLRREAADQLKKMLSDYYSEFKTNLVVASAYRSYNEQYVLYNYWTSEIGVQEANRSSARPGYSEHQLGTVVDFVDKESGYELTEKFAETKSFKWLSDNAHKYGFVMSYPKDKEDVTGYKFEPWHWRYIGVENANNYNKIKDGITLNQWLKQQ